MITVECLNRRARWAAGAGGLLGIVLMVLVLSLLAGCEQVPAPSLVREAQAAEFDPAPAVALRHRAAITREGRFVWGLDAPIPAFAAQIMQESGYNEAARSPYAGGLAQFTPATADWIGSVYPDLGPAQPFNPDWAIRALVRYDRWLFERVRYSRECDRFAAALSAYNGGLGWHAKRQGKAADRDDFWTSVRTVNPGITRYNQTENELYPVYILIKHQPRFRVWGRTICTGKEVDP